MASEAENRLSRALALSIRLLDQERGYGRGKELEAELESALGEQADSGRPP